MNITTLSRHGASTSTSCAYRLPPPATCHMPPPAVPVRTSCSGICYVTYDKPAFGGSGGSGGDVCLCVIDVDMRGACVVLLTLSHRSIWVWVSVLHAGDAKKLLCGGLTKN